MRTPRHASQRFWLLTLVMAIFVLAAACGDDADDDTAADADQPADAPEPAEDAAADPDGDVLIGLVTKTETNPFFVKMREGANDAAGGLGAEVQAFSGDFDGDNETQVQAVETLTQAGATAILITPNDPSAIVPALEQAREAGLLVIALDTPTDPEDAVDAVFATDNFEAGVLIGEYAAAKFDESGEEPRIAMLDLEEGITVGDLRHDGFLEGFGIEDGDPAIVGSEFTRGDQAEGRTAMENLLQRDPEINLVYSINEPAGRGGYEAVAAAGREDEVMIVSVDGGCPGVQDVAEGRLAATSMQFPLRMAELGVEAAVEYAESGEAPSGFVDTGVELITDDPVEGIESQDSVWGEENCWG